MPSKIVPVVASLVVLTACGGAPKEPAAPETPAAPQAPTAAPGDTAAADDVKAPGEAKPGDKSRCTVTGEDLEVNEDTPHAEYKGKTYYFCCPGCKKKFEANPEQFIKS